MSATKSKYLIPLRVLLLPLAFLYGIVIDIRNLLYNIKWFKSEAFPIPVISVGNITAGGTGKTPVTIFLAEQLQNQDRKVAVVSRGYGRTTKGLQIVSDGKGNVADPDTAGDEPCLIARKVPECLVVVSETRKEALDYLLKKTDADIVILDDAFQHRQLSRNLDIVLLNCKEQFKYNFMLPSGTLREFKHNLSRANLILHTNSDQENRTALYNDEIPSFFSNPQFGELVDLGFSSVGSIERFKDANVVAFAGIAHPQNFLDLLHTNGVKPVTFFEFPDHSEYTVQDLEKLFLSARDNKASTLFCTEKDLMKLIHLNRCSEFIEKQGIKLLAVSIKIVIDQQEKMIELINQYIDN